MLQIDNLTYRIEGRTLFDGASVVVPSGARTGLVGRNGTGKTTLFRLILGEIAADDGTVAVHKRARVGSVAQEAPGGQRTVLDVVMGADKERAELQAEAETATDATRIAEIHTRLADISAHTAEARASAILKGLGFGAEARAMPCGALSGGWRMRVALASVLFTEPDLLLLDEPTNYLDLEGALWLENYLARYPHTVLLISHDRDLLNKAVDSVIHLDRGKLTLYRGNYDTFEATRQTQMELHNKAREKQVAQIAHMQAFVERFRYKATKARQAQSRLKRIEKMRPPEALYDEDVTPFVFPPPKRAVSAPILNLEDVSVGYDGTPVLSRLNLRLDPEDRIALIGVNGNGKSTFAKLLAGDLPPMGGKVTRARKLEVAYFAQHQLERLVPGQSPVDHLEPLTPFDSDAKRRSRIAQMGLPASRMDTPAASLSGGERARLMLGLITLNGPNLLILDEPTNHLDIDSRDALIQSLNDFEGAVLIISHDRHLVEATVDRLWIAAEGTVSSYDEDLDAYQRTLTGGEGPGRGDRDSGTGTGANGDGRKRARQEAAAKRAETAPLRKAIRRAEETMARLDARIAAIEDELGDPALYAGDPDRVIALNKERADLAAEHEQAEADWLDASEKLERAEAAQRDGTEAEYRDRATP